MKKHKTSEAKLASSRAWKIKNAEYLRQMNKKRNAAIRADPIAWAKKLESNRVSRKKHLEKRREYDRARDDQKKSARSRIRKRILRGTLKRGSCEVCHAPNAEAHHDDYSKALEVRWFCPLHHRQYHDKHDK